jgi:hypothetical protein
MEPLPVLGDEKPDAAEALAVVRGAPVHFASRGAANHQGPAPKPTTEPLSVRLPTFSDDDAYPYPAERGERSRDGGDIAH